jgi:hypothetical protein
LRYFDKLLNFFSSSYSNNARFHHSTLGYLKIFFERNNKIKSTFAVLGNVFRNSKWSDLKVQNIKTSFIKSWSSYFIVILFVLSLCFSFFGVYASSTILPQIPFFGDIYEILCFTWTHAEDFLKSLLLLVFSTWSYLKTLLLQGVKTKQNYVYESLSSSNKPSLAVSTKTSGAWSLSKDGVANGVPIEVMYKLSNASKSMRNTDSATITNLYLSSTYANGFNTSKYLNYSSGQSTNVSELLTIANIEYSYTTTSLNSEFVQQFDTESANLNKVGIYNSALAITNLNTQDALKSSKQDRWLVRNSLLSENLVLNSSAFTQSKKLLGVNFLNSEAASKNVWNSTKINSLDSTSGTTFISNLQELFSNQPLHNDNLAQLNATDPNLVNFNFFENSRMWLVKKYFFTNQLKNNLTRSSVTSTTINITDVMNTNTLNFTLFLNLHNQNLKSQLSFLTLFTEPLRQVNSSTPINGAYNFYVSAGDLDVLKSNNLSFLNKLTHSTSTAGLNYYTTLASTDSPVITSCTLSFKK